MDWSVRTATPADADAVATLLHDFNVEFESPTPPIPALARRMAALMGGEETVVLVGGSGPDGLALLRFRPSIWSAGLECYLAELYVMPDRRGRGLGRALMTAALQLARDRGADTMDIGVDEPDLPARKLYESLGFANRNEHGDVMYVYERDL